MSAASWIALAQAIVAVVLTLITLVYVLYTRRMSKTAAAQLEAQLRPYVSADLVLKPSGMVMLRVRNTGLSAAQNLTLSLDREVKTTHDNALNELPIFTSGLPQFPPDGQVAWMLGASHQLLEKLGDFTLECKYTQAGRSYSDAWPLTLDRYFGTTLPPKSEVAKEVEDLKKELAKVSASLKKLADRQEALPPLGPW